MGYVVLCPDHQAGFWKPNNRLSYGCPTGGSLGPLLFSLAIHSTIQELNNLIEGGAKLDMTAFYLDDGIIAGDVKVVAKALELLESRCTAIGLTLNHGKSELVLPDSNTDANLSELFPRDLLVDRETG